MLRLQKGALPPRREHTCYDYVWLGLKMLHFIVFSRTVLPRFCLAGWLFQIVFCSFPWFFRVLRGVPAHSFRSWRIVPLVPLRPIDSSWPLQFVLDRAWLAPVLCRVGGPVVRCRFRLGIGGPGSNSGRPALPSIAPFDRACVPDSSVVFFRVSIDIFRLASAIFHSPSAI